MTSFIIAPVWHDRRRNYGCLLFPPVSFVPVHLDSLVNSRRILVRHARVSKLHLRKLGPAQVGPFLFCSKSGPDPKTCSSPPAPRRKRGHRRPNLPPKTRCRPNAHARPYRPEKRPHRVTETASRAPRTAYDPRQPPRLGGPRRPAASPGGLVNRFKLSVLPADSPHRAVFLASPKNRHDAHASCSIKVFLAARKFRHDAHASCSQIFLVPFLERAEKFVMMRAQAVLRSLSASFFQRPEDSVMMRARAILKVLVFLATSEFRHDARAKT